MRCAGRKDHTLIICQCPKEWHPYSRVYCFLFSGCWDSYHGMAPFAGYPQPLFPPFPPPEPATAGTRTTTRPTCSGPFVARPVT
ncbi:hypothetical protein BQ8420_12215 [Nocardiopsis sp. JB363]|nr:hypothetical protein BQ8420_12215 [Nocardiopsis sp. JB363]